MKTLISFLNESIQKKQIFVIIKPGFQDKTQEIINRFEEEGWSIKRTTIKKLLLTEAHKLYAIHKKEDWYEDLCKYMSSDITRAFIFCKSGDPDSAFDEVRKLKDEIRKEYGESDMRNVIHSSDSAEHMEQEMSIYF